MTLEELLNKLIEKGFVPFNIPGITELKYYETKQKLWITSFQNTIEYHDEFSLRDICSSESLLWQFVCDREHRFIDKKNYDSVSLDKRLKNPYVDYDGVNTEYERITVLDYQYWLIESALKNESELEQFLLQNIKIGDI